MNVYFIKTGDAIKVGIATDVNSRLVSVQVGNPHKMTLLHSISTSEQHAREIESQIHNLFHKTNLNGEWYQANQFMMDFITHIKRIWMGNPFRLDREAISKSLWRYFDIFEKQNRARHYCWQYGFIRKT